METWPELRTYQQYQRNKGIHERSTEGRHPTNRARSYFSKLLGKPPDIDMIEDEYEKIEPSWRILISKLDYSPRGILRGKSSLVGRKSCVEDCISPEGLKRCNLDDIVLDFCNQTRLFGKKPEQWSNLNIILILKAGDLSKGRNYWVSTPQRHCG